jgi:biotin synthase
MQWKTLAKKTIQGYKITKAEALQILSSADDDLLDILSAAFLIRRYFFGRGIALHVIQNAKSGLCSENCSFCSQSISVHSGVAQYLLQDVEKIITGAHQASKLNALRYCIVTSGREPSSDDLDTICKAVRQIKKDVNIEICTSLGLLNMEQARRLKDAGVDRFNHNLESSERFYPSICTTHSYPDRIRTAETVKTAGLELCSGGLIGMGESFEDRVDLAFSLRDIGADSIPLNFLDSRPGTALEHLIKLLPCDCLRTLAMFRFILPDKEIRIAGGREVCLGSMQVLSLYAANSIFTEGYLTTSGQGYTEDIKMIDQAGFEVTGWTAA